MEQVIFHACILQFRSSKFDVKEFSLDAENFDLEATMTCGQTFCWHRISGKLYEDGKPHFYTFRDGKPLIVEQKNSGEIIAKTELDKSEVEEALGLHKILRVFSQLFLKMKISALLEKSSGGLE